MRTSDGLENLVVTGSIEGRRARWRQRMKYLDSLCVSWKDNVNSTQFIRTSEERELWHHTVAKVAVDGSLGLPHLIKNDWIARNVLVTSYWTLR